MTQRMGWRSGEVEHVRGDYKLKKRVTCRHEKGGFIYESELSVKQQKGKEHEYQTQI